MSLFENRTDKDIGKLLEISSEAARKRRRRAIEKFLEYLNEKYEITSIEEWIENYKYLDIDKSN